MKTVSLVFVLAILLVVSFVFVYDGSEKVTLDVEKSVNGNANSYSLTVSSNGEPLENVFILVYSDGGEEVYGYPYLRTNERGKVEFNLDDQRYRFLLGGSKTSGLNKGFLLEQSLNVSKEPLKKISLNSVEVDLENFPSWTPHMKLEGRPVSKDISFSPIDFHFFNPDVNDTETSFFLGDGSYNINFDVQSFNEFNSRSLAIGLRNVSHKKSSSYEVSFDDLKKYTVDMENTENAWFKLKYGNGDVYSTGPVMGDFQSMYFGKPVDIYSNLDSLYAEMAYIPSDKCVHLHRSQDSSKSRPRILWKCMDFDIRYDFMGSDITEGKTVLKPPSVVEAPKSIDVSRGENFYLDYNITDGDGTQVSDISVHQIWSKDILPVMDVESMDGEDNYTLNIGIDGTVDACLPPGKYKYSLVVPGLTWNDRIESNVGEIKVSEGFSCINQTLNNVMDGFETWEDVYRKRFGLFKHRGKNQISLEYNSPDVPDFNNTDSLDRVSSCEDMSNVSDGSTVIVEYSNEDISNYTRNSVYSECMSKFSDSNMTYILKDMTEKPYPTYKWYTAYHFYRSLKKDGNMVGFMPYRFITFFYQFPDFFAVDDIQERYSISVDEVKSLLEEYDAVVSLEKITSLGYHKNISDGSFNDSYSDDSIYRNTKDLNRFINIFNKTGVVKYDMWGMNSRQLYIDVNGSYYSTFLLTDGNIVKEFNDRCLKSDNHHITENVSEEGGYILWRAEDLYVISRLRESGDVSTVESRMSKEFESVKRISMCK